ncbi:RNA polymerase sigma factor [Flavobacterium sp. CS20]|jgi:RNA polymerase sigma-70 factor (ECF subfamily)|uniref:RNA polymerase sigma factor n=1 Tax=Flavobacterium sp. CS20 TaxID=2775246 RepID=UPI001B3A164F|nr:sigma-70 family RNA polymerase sigma factor [Flavobacterium sp. CS20]QTY28183.1 sigma-70 family RNA polymerase sigma factor [Flavobacterium sp. CS20]
MDIEEEKELISRLCSENQSDSAFTELVELYKEQLYWHIRYLLKNHEDTDDVLQNVFIKIYKNIKKFKGDSRLYSWMYRIAKNESLTFLKKRSKMLKISDEELQTHIVDNLKSDVYFEGDQIQLKLHKAISTLPEKQKEVFQLRYFEEMKYQDMAELLQTSESALKSNYHHASKKVEQYLKSN